MNNVGNFLKEQRGTEADQKIIHEVIEISNRATKSYEDFNLALKEPNLFQKMMLKWVSRGKNGYVDKIQKNAISSYNLLEELRKHCIKWVEILQKSMFNITESSLSDRSNVILLEKYIVAGAIAQIRIEEEIEKARKKCEETGLQEDMQIYEELKKGNETFTIVLANLEKSRVMYLLSIAQLAVTQQSNIDTQNAIRTQMNNELTALGQQLRNAILNVETKQVLDAKQALNRLSGEFTKQVTQEVVETGKKARREIYSGTLNVEDAKHAIKTIIDGCQVIQRTAEEMLPKVKADLSELNNLVEELEPYITRINKENNSVANMVNNTKNSLSKTELNF